MRQNRDTCTVDLPPRPLAFPQCLHPGFLYSCRDLARMGISMVIKALLAATAVAPMLAHAESSTTSGAGALNVTAHVDFQITIPKLVFLRVGTGTGTLGGGYANNATVDQITW